jgi:hypothetical protein
VSDAPEGRRRATGRLHPISDGSSASGKMLRNMRCFLRNCHSGAARSREKMRDSGPPVLHCTPLVLHSYSAVSRKVQVDYSEVRVKYECSTAEYSEVRVKYECSTAEYSEVRVEYK